MNRCAKIKARVDAIIDEASRKNVPSRALRKALKIRAKRQKLQAQIDELEIEERDAVQHILTVNNDPSDLPLFGGAKILKIETTRAEAAE
jgi:seryl-tRNA synthetase